MSRDGSVLVSVKVQGLRGDPLALVATEYRGLRAVGLVAVGTGRRIGNQPRDLDAHRRLLGATVWRLLGDSRASGATHEQEPTAEAAGTTHPLHKGKGEGLLIRHSEFAFEIHDAHADAGGEKLIVIGEMAIVQCETVPLALAREPREPKLVGNLQTSARVTMGSGIHDNVVAMPLTIDRGVRPQNKGEPITFAQLRRKGLALHSPRRMIRERSHPRDEERGALRFEPTVQERCSSPLREELPEELVLSVGSACEPMAVSRCPFGAKRNPRDESAHPLPPV